MKQKYLENLKPEELELIKGLLVPDNVGTRDSVDVLPKPIADEVVKQIREKNIARQIFKVYTLDKDSLTIPTWANDNTNVYQVSAAGGNASGITEQSPSAGSVVLQPGKIAAKSYLTFDDLRDSSLALIDLLVENLAESVARAEERGLLVGEKDRASAVATKVVDGLFTIADSAAKCNNTKITFTSATEYAIANAIAEGIKDLGLYGRGELILICSPEFAFRLKTDKRMFLDVSGFNPIKDGKLPRAFGVSIYETTYAPAYKAVLVPRDEPRIGVGRNMELKSDDEIEYDRRLFVLMHKYDMVLPHQTSSKCDAIIELEDLNT